MHQALLECISTIGMLFGVFGNVNAIVAISRKKILRTKGAMFVLILAITHLVCNISELVGLATQLRFRPMSRKKCFEYNILYQFAIMFQSALFLSIALDLCFSIVLPIRHMIWKKRRYVSIMCIFPLFFAIATTILAFLFIPDEETPNCLFLLTPDIRVYQIVSSSLIVLNTLTLVIILCSVVLAVRKSDNMRGSRHSSSGNNSLREEKHKVFRSTFFLVLIYIVSWWSVVIIFRILVEILQDVEEVIHYMPYMIVIVMPNFCQVFWVTYFRSPRFKKAYNEQLNWLTCGFCFPHVFDKKRQESRNGIHGSATNSNHQTSETEKRKQRSGSEKSIRFSVQVTV